MSEKVRLLVVEDEVLLAQDIQMRLHKLGYEEVHLAHNAEEALHVWRAQQPDIMIVDIYLEDGGMDGVELMRVIRQTSELPFIFLTSYSDEETINRAKTVKPYAYMLKPFNETEVRLAIDLALINFSSGQVVNERMQSSGKLNEDALSINDSLFLKRSHHFERVPFQNILWLEANNNYTTIYTDTGAYVYSTVLKKVEQVLPATSFFRVHRSYVINKDKITGFEGNCIYVDKKKIPVSKQHREEVFKWFRVI